jgi:acyl carrier protein
MGPTFAARERPRESVVRRYHPGTMSLTREQVLERTTEILKKHAKGELELSEKTVIVADLGIDSLGVMEALAEVEDALGVTFDDEQLQGIATLGDLVDLIVREFENGG